jgi:ATP-dependent DNA helicase RecG
MNNENQNIEYKESWRDEYVKWLCGFANAQGGKLYIGINDKGEVCGVENAHKLSEDIPNKVVSFLGIVAEVNVLDKEGKDYIEIDVAPSDVPISYKGKYYFRSGSTLQELNGAAMQSFVLKKMGRSWDEVINDRATLKDIDREAVDYFIRKGIEAGRVPDDLHKASTEEVLTSLGLIDDNGGLTNAAVLLFGKNPQRYYPSAVFKIGRFGIDEADLRFQDVIEGNILQMAEHVMDVLKAKYLISPVRFEGMQRYEKLELPKEALREILYNAIAHKDYTGPDIQMHVYDSSMEIWNEGELPEGYTQETLFASHSSKPRNRKIANVFFKAGFIDTWGRGFQKIRDGFEADGIPMPKVENFCGGVRVTIERTVFVKLSHVGSSVGSDVTSSVTSMSPVKLTERQQDMLELIRKNPFISAQQMSVVLSVVKRTIERDLADLQKKGILIREGNTSAGHWEIIGK